MCRELHFKVTEQYYIEKIDFLRANNYNLTKCLYEFLEYYVPDSTTENLLKHIS